jgi:hypothetical protein
MEMKKYIDIVEAFGRGDTSDLDKELKNKVPKSAVEVLGDTIGVVGLIAGLVTGAVKGFTFFEYPKGLANLFITGPIGTVLGAVLGGLPGAIISGASKSSRSRGQLKQEKVSAYLQNNPTLLDDVDKFVQGLILQTPKSIIKNANYITHMIIDSIEGGGSGEISTGSLDTQTQKRVEETKKLIYGYFSQKEKEWEALAKKYNIDPATLHQLVNEYGSKNSIEEQWLDGIKAKLTAPVNEEPIEEASDESIARIVELSKDKK